MKIYHYLFKNSSVETDELEALPVFPTDFIVRKDSHNIRRLKKEEIGVLMPDDSMFLLHQDKPLFIASLWAARNREIHKHECLIQSKKKEIEMFKNLMNQYFTYEKTKE